MLSCVHLLLLCALCVLNYASSADVFLIEHSLDGGVTFHKRSSFQHSATGKISMVTSEEEKNGAERVSIIQEEVEAFKSLLSTNAMYTLRISEQCSDCTSAAIYAAIPAVRTFCIHSFFPCYITFFFFLPYSTSLLSHSYTYLTSH